MQIERDTVLPGPPGRAFALIDDLSAYPSWMDLVHEVDEEPPSGDRRVWSVELRAQVGPLARSKRLRMVRVVHEPHRRVVFERDEIDGRQHSPWTLAATLRPDSSDTGATRLTMTLAYGGSLWTGVVLQRVLDDHIERGAVALNALLTGAGDPDVDH